MKLAAVVIWYNPLEIGEEKIIQNIFSYSSYCEKNYIVDNSSDLHEELAKKIPNSIYISNKNVGGIAGGQNRGCERALNDGFEWAMTMDQDSIFEPKQVKEYIRLVEEYIPTDEKAVSFGPKIKNLNETLYWTKWISSSHKVYVLLLLYTLLAFLFYSKLRLGITILLFLS